MISVIIPLMSIPPYGDQIGKCLRSLKRQSAEHEVIVEYQEPDCYIKKNKLLNQGIEKVKGDIVWFCDADFILDDPTLLERMEAGLNDVIYPMFYSPIFKGYKIADGAAFIRKDVLAQYGKLDESLIGIGGVTFDLLNWCMDNTNFQCSPEYLLRLNYFPSVKYKDKAPQKTVDRTKELHETTKDRLQKMGLWPE